MRLDHEINNKPSPLWVRLLIWYAVLIFGLTCFFVLTSKVDAQTDPDTGNIFSMYGQYELVIPIMSNIDSLGNRLDTIFIHLDVDSLPIHEMYVLDSQYFHPVPNMWVGSGVYADTMADDSTVYTKNVTFIHYIPEQAPASITDLR